MSKGFHRDRQEDIESVVAVQFSIFSPKEIEDRSVVEITSQATYEGSEPKTGGLFDARMGVLDNGKKCLSCGQTNHGCPGHFGHFRLTRPVYYIQFLPTIQNVLRCVCVRCGKLKIDKSFHTNLEKRKGEARWKEVTKLCQPILRCGQEAEGGCGALQPFKIERKGIANLVAHFMTDQLSEATKALNAATKASNATAKEGDKEVKKEVKEMALEVEEVHRLFRRISDEDVDFMGLSRHWCRPDWMICTVLPIPPPQVRPSVVQDNNTRSEDDLTHKLAEIIKSDHVLQKKIEDGTSENVITEYTNVLQYHIATLVDNQIPGVAPSAQRSGRPLKSIQQRIGSKEGRIRYNIQGKRVEFSARSVITPDPNISIDELGVPMEIATNLTFPERITQFNKTKLYKFVQNGADKWPGAKTIMRKDGRMISLKHVNTNEIVLYNGDVVNRHLIDGDIVLFNRQPTLHKMSMMAHRVKVLPYKTFRLNVLVTRPYNADFDGDEMNMHVPQSYEAAVELEEIAAIPHNVVSPRHAKPLIGTFQDSVVGSYRITRPTSRFNRREFMNLMMRNKRFDGLLPKLNEQGLYTGQQVISQLLPPLNVNIPDKLTIDQGNITMGQLTSGVYMEPGKGIIHILYNDYGPKETTMFLDSLQRVIEDYLVLNGFSVGISDLVADDKTTEGIKKTIEDCKKKIEELQLLVHMDLFENNTGKTNQEEFEDKAYSILNEANGTAEKAVKKSLSSENRLVAMINSGSKGKWLNIAQMIACLGQQSIENKRVPYGFTDRTLPHYKKYDDGAEARGFVESSFIQGLPPQHFFMHAISGREGLIDTAVKTADTGYIQRQLIKALEDFVVHHDRTVRDANMNVLQFEYGEDGIAATKVEDQALPKYSEMSKETIETTYGLKGVAWGEVLLEGVSRPAGEQDLLNLHVQQILEDQKILVEQVYKNSEFGGDVKSPVNLARMILNIKARFGLGGKTDLTPYIVLTRIPVILERTRSAHNHIWGALLRYYLSPHKILVEDRFTVKALDALTELIVVAHMKSWVQPGEQVGIVAAQSIGEPSTQLTLNSVAWDERIIIAKDGKLISPMIGAFIDDYQATCDPKRVQFLEKDQIYIDLKEDGHTWQAFSCDENGKAVWTTLEAITKHPVVNEDGTDTILEVELESGRTVKATKGKSFLTVIDGLLTATNGSELKIGDELPCSLSLGIKELGTVGTLDLRSILPLTEWIYGSEVTKALTIMNSENAKGNRHWFQVNQGSAFTVPYNRSDSFRDAFVNGKNPHDIREGHVYPKNIHLKASQIPAVLPLDAEFGFFCGAYLAEGMSNKTQVNLTNNESSYLDSVQKLMDRWDVGTHRVEGPKHAKETTDIKGYTTSLIIHSTVLAKVMGTLFGKTSYQKDIPDWVLQAPDVFVKALVDGYVSGDGCVHLNGSIVYSSVSEALITKMNAIMARYGIFTTISSYMPDIRKFKSVSRCYRSYIGQYHTTLFANQFTLCIPKKQERLNAHLKGGSHKFRKTLMGDVALDKIKTIKEIRPLKGLVYDLTVEKTRNFMLLNTVACRDTFHTAGVATKNNVTTGIPRLREILKVTKNPKASSLTIPMKAEFNETDERGREKAREIKQDLELTLLRHITNKVAIYWDPTDEATVIEEDREMLKFYREMELDMPSSNLLAATEGDTTKINPWLLRFELNREEMYNKNITMADVVFVIKTIYNTVKLVYSDYNAQSLIMRIRMEFDMEEGKTYEDYFSLLKKFENKMLNSCVIRGVPGIKAVTFRKDEQKVFLVNGKYEKKSQYILDTDGSNYVRVMNHPAVDANRLYTTNIHDIMDILGLEAVRAILLSEIMPIFSSEAVNYRHLGILCDYITRSGRLMSVDRYGVNKNETGPLGKMSFEETTKIVMDAARFGEVDPMNGVSANIMMGQPFRGGTAFSQILLDDDMLMKLSSEGPVYEPEEDNESVTSVEDVMDADAPCSTAQFRINMVMPSIHRSQEEDLDEDDVELIPLQTTT